ncbi:unnamed protein product [Ilex paraguariensis]|uniref:Uncharacterized protein n=1 Tax=Ilex paraguariensis TaxID=185542 RepID=A0ABC8RD75_9AQUA
MKDAGFGAFISFPFIQMGHSYTHMQAERWFPNPSNLHLPVGEFVPNLYNWLAILGISLGVGLEGQRTFTLRHLLQILRLGGHVVRTDEKILITSAVCKSLDVLRALIVGSVGHA